MLTQEFVQGRLRHLLSKKARVLEDLQQLSRRPVDQRVRHKRDVLLPLIDAAVKRIENGRYGVCADCDEQIPEKRLEARPEVVRCVGCQTAREGAANDRR